MPSLLNALTATVVSEALTRPCPLSLTSAFGQTGPPPGARTERGRCAVSCPPAAKGEVSGLENKRLVPVRKGYKSG